MTWDRAVDLEHACLVVDDLEDCFVEDEALRDELRDMFEERHLDESDQVECRAPISVSLAS